MNKIISFCFISIIYVYSPTEIQFIKVYSTLEDFTTVTPVRCGDLTHTANEWVDSLTITDQVFFDEIEKEITKLVSHKDSLRHLMPRLDTRVEVYIDYYSSETKLLCLNKYGDIVFQDTTMNESRSLIDLVYSKIKENE